jgi:hypothetical protein
MIDIDVDKNQLLKEIEDLINIRNFRLSMFHKVEELKDIYRPDIEKYKQITAMIEPEKDKMKAPKSFDGHSFEIFRRGKRWTPSIDIPQVIIDFIVNSHIKPGIPKMDRRLKFQGLKGQYTLTFEKKDDGHFTTGTIQIEKDAAAPPGGNLIVLQSAPHKNDFKEFLFYLTTNKSLYEYVMSEFLFKWKPAIDLQFYNGEINAEKSF